MVAPAGAATIQNTGKCPHGLPIGACPICSGMGGGGGIRQNKDKPRVAGEMSYNECMAAWIKIQAAKEAKIEAQIQRLENAQAMHLQHRMIMGLEKAVQKLDTLVQKLDQMPKIIAIPAKILINVLIKPVLNLISNIPQIINSIQTFISNVRNFITSVGEKLASVFGEVKNFIDAKISQPIKKAIKSVLNFFTQGEEDENEEVEKLKAREIKKVLKGLFRIKDNKEKELEKEEEKL
ncbi:MAG: hypothetical protein IJB79_06630 [Candidatus Gastranaerophilales bacterium]|nr:hypothetical protein [Candidatus Gastranaerophilales bacterium]